MKIQGWLQRAAVSAPERTAVETPAGSLTYAELAAGADLAAGRLAARDVGPGDRVAIVLAPGLAFAELLHGCWRLGAVPVPVDPRLGDVERLQQTATAALVLDAPLEGDAADAVLLDAHDHRATAAIMHTSGSTGDPRPVELTFGNFRWNAIGSALALGLDREERWLSPLPVCHVGGLTVLVRSAAYATAAVAHPAFEADRVAHALSSEGVTVVSLVATTLARTLDAGLAEAPALRCALIGGGPLPAALRERAAEAGIPLAQTYGLTEACSQVTVSAIGEPETAGRPIATTHVALRPDGEIVVSGATVAPGAAGPGGRLRTGDLGEIDRAGRLTVTGRVSATIVTGGENVAPAEVEVALESHPAVAEAAVFGRPDPEWGEAVTAAVVLREGMKAEPNELRNHARRRLAGFKVPKAVHLVSTLPRTAAGKLRRGELPKILG